MTIQQLLKHFNNNYIDVAHAIGYTEPAVRHWVNQNRIPFRAQIVIESATNGKLVARKEKKRG